MFLSMYSIIGVYSLIVLDDCGSRRDIFAPSIGGTILKTQSLPACVRSKTRPLSTADDPAELYAKVRGVFIPYCVFLFNEELVEYKIIGLIWIQESNSNF